MYIEHGDCSNTVYRSFFNTQCLASYPNTSYVTGSVKTLHVSMQILTNFLILKVP